MSTIYIMSTEMRVLDGHEMPLKLQLDHSQKKPYIELRLFQVRDTLTPSMMSLNPARGGAGGMKRAESEDSLEGEGDHNIVPKEEGERWEE